MEQKASQLRYEFIEHTADEGLKAYGNTPEELFENTAAGMFHLIADEKNINSQEMEKVTIEAPDYEELLKNWLSELLYIHSTRYYLLSEFNVGISHLKNGRKKLKGTVRGELLNPDKHSILTEIKTVTYHQLYVVKKENYWEAQVIFDV